MTSIAEIHTLIASGETASSIEALRTEALRLREADIAEKVEVLRQDYTLMISYFRAGGKDSQRANILCKMRQRAHDLADDLRTAAIRKGADAGSRERAMAQHVAQDLSALTARPSDELVAALLRQRLTAPDVRMATDAIANDGWSIADNTMLTGALALNLITRHNDNIAIGLMRLLGSDTISTQVAGRAIAGLVCDMMAHAERWTEDKILTDSLELTLEQRPHLTQVFRSTAWAILQTKLTNEIANYLRETMGSEISRIAKRIADNAKDNAPRTITPDDLAEIFGPDSESVKSKFDKIARWQKSGADVAFSTYKILKDSSFFKKEENWIRPFDKDCKEVSALIHAEGPAAEIAQTLAESAAFCDSDKFSMMLTVDMVPDEELKKLNAHFIQETQIMSDLMAEEYQMSGSSLKTAISARFFVHDLYRMLHVGHSGDVSLGKALDADVAALIDSPMGRAIFTSADDIDALGRHAVDNELWDDATRIYALLADSKMATDANWQRKFALCLLQSGQDAKALDTLRRADLLDDANSWTKTKLAEIFHKNGDWRAALFHIEAVAELKTPSLRIDLMRADCLRNIGRTDDAIKLLARLDYEHPGRTDVCRILAETYAATGRRDEASNHFAALPDDALTASDLRLMAIIKLAEGDNNKAIDLLRRAAETGSGSPTPQDSLAMKAMGVDPQEFRLASDANIIM